MLPTIGRSTPGYLRDRGTVRPTSCCEMSRDGGQKEPLKHRREAGSEWRHPGDPLGISPGISNGDVEPLAEYCVTKAEDRGEQDYTNAGASIFGPAPSRDQGCCRQSVRPDQEVSAGAADDCKHDLLPASCRAAPGPFPRRGSSP